MEHISATNRGFPLVRQADGHEPPPFFSPPDFESENLWGWWMNRPGVLTFIPNASPLLHKDAAALAAFFSFPQLCATFPNAEKFYFLHHFGNGRGYESAARVALVEWGKTIPHRVNGGAEVQINSNASALERMGLATASTALALTGRHLDVVPSITAFCNEHNIQAVGPGPHPTLR